ncbi:ExbD/TolR family protein [Tateyamaria sp. SN3-11]|uniref:ExbD/TolR family protein n=1 Tax=Tateyamaria sp. SN3-11 TaxID=3092147 RepID=UPI0039EA0C00
MPENIIPMINVVFLLLIFFLMTSQIAPPETLDVTPPEAETGLDGDGDLTLYLDASGQLGFDQVIGTDDAVIAALIQARDASCAAENCASPSLQLRADGLVPATRVAALLKKLAVQGFSDIGLTTVAP